MKISEQKMLSVTIGVVLLLISNMLTPSDQVTPLAKTRVVLQNLIPKQNVTIHCWSSDDDLGTHQLAFNATFSWHFRLNLWMTTKFVCDFTTNKNSGRYTVYDIYHEYVCHKYCLWEITSDFPCLVVKDNPKMNACEIWQHNRSIANASSLLIA
ncbi:hypothetical protein CASFOL_006738 [Castilleja foliolosa]|uniref:S-protein homolog n=1 Tax=Castilleja foliolosa TaxID=1961234 RepID=A0ABD3EB51_9LAMI